MSKIKKINIAHITIEAKTALRFGCNRVDFFQDSPIQRDWNNLPMILGTSLAGVLRKEFKKINEKDENELFGYSEEKSDEGQGSRVIISNALIVNNNSKVYEKPLLQGEISKFLKEITKLSKRDHTAITDKGVAKDKSKYDEEIIYKGTQFRFSIEVLYDEEDVLDNEKNFKEILNLLYKNSFRIGAGSSRGFGEIEVKEIKTKSLEISSEEYVEYSPSLNGFNGEDFKKEEVALKNKKKIQKDFTTYKLKLKPDDFFMFGSGLSDLDSDLTAVKERIVSYEKGGLLDEELLIPASSIKGAIRHKTKFYHNLAEKNYIGSDKVLDDSELFGCKKDGEKGAKAKLLISDVYKKEFDEKVFDHVKIDRFSGGGIDGALFQEKTSTTDEIEIKITLLEEIKDESLEKAFERSLKDIADGRLSLGGAVNKGHGVFSGKVYKDENEI